MSFDGNPPYAPFKRMEAGTVIWDFDRIRLKNGFRVGTNLNLVLNYSIYTIVPSAIAELKAYKTYDQLFSYSESNRGHKVCGEL